MFLNNEFGTNWKQVTNFTCSFSSYTSTLESNLEKTTKKWGKRIHLHMDRYMEDLREVATSRKDLESFSLIASPDIYFYIYISLPSSKA